MLELCLVRCATDARLSSFFVFVEVQPRLLHPEVHAQAGPNPRTVQTELAPGKVASVRYLADIYSTDRFSRCDGASAPFI